MWEYINLWHFCVVKWWKLDTLYWCEGETCCMTYLFTLIRSTRHYFFVTLAPPLFDTSCVLLPVPVLAMFYNVWQPANIYTFLEEVNFKKCWILCTYLQTSWNCAFSVDISLHRSNSKLGIWCKLDYYFIFKDSCRHVTLCLCGRKDVL